MTDHTAATTHITGPALGHNGRIRQLCTWCGFVIDDHVAGEIMVEVDGFGDTEVPTWPTDVFLRIDGNVRYQVEIEEGDMPEDSCAHLPVTDDRGVLR